MVKSNTRTAVIEKPESTGKPGALPKSLESYMPLVYSIASLVSNKGLPPSIDYNDLVSDGVVGLMKAWDNFDPTRGVKFETYASYRVRGEILDGLKNYNPVPYRVQVMIRDLAKKGYKEYAKERAAEIRQEKLLEKRELNEKEFDQAVNRIQKIISASALMYLLSLEELTDTAESEVEGERTPAGDLEFQEMRERMSGAIRDLPPQEQKVLDLFYNKEWSQKDISEALKLSRSKVNRLIWHSVEELRAKLGTGT